MRAFAITGTLLLAAGIAIADSANQTKTFSPIINGGTPFRVTIEEVLWAGDSLPTIQSAAYARFNHYLVFIGGRTSGMHDFTCSPEDNFEPTRYNREVFVIDYLNELVYHRSLDDSDLSTAQIADLARTLETLQGHALSETVASVLSVAPALVALRGSALAAYHGVEHKEIAADEQGLSDPAQAAKEHERCGSNLLAPLLIFSIAGLLLTEHLLDEPGQLARGAAGVAGVSLAVEMFVWAARHPDSAFTSAFRRPGSEIQRLIATREPTAQQLEVGTAALTEVLRMESMLR